MFRFSNTHRLNSLFRFLSIPAFVAIISLIAVINTQAQDSLKGVTPSGLTPGAPAGSHSLNSFESINPFNGNLNFNLLLAAAGGRGGAGTTANLLIQQKWSVRREVDPVYATVTNYPDYTGWVTGPVYAGAHIERRSAGNTTNICADIILGNRPVYLKSLTRLTVTIADGTEFELRDTAAGGEPKLSPRNSSNCPISSQNRGKIFVTSDGSAATFVSDSEIIDDPYADSDSWADVSGYLYLKDGSRWRFVTGAASEFRDRNGNKLTFAYTGGGSQTITDSLNRQLVITLNYTDATYGLCDKITYKGFGGSSRTIFLTLAQLSSTLRSGETLKTYAQLFPSLNGSSGSSFNPYVRNSVVLPNGKSYQFKYNSYGELARVVLPTGGAFEYDWDAGDAATVSDGGAVATWKYMDYGIYRRLLERRSYANGSTLDNKIIYERPANLNSNADSSVVTETRDSGNNLLAKSKSWFYGNARYSFEQIQYATDYSRWRDGMEYQTEEYSTNGYTSLRLVENTFAQRASVSWWGGSPDNEPPNDPRLTSATTSLTDETPVLKSKQEFTYDRYNNKTDVKEYDYNSTTPSAPAFTRLTHTDFVTSIGGSDYANPAPSPTASPTPSPTPSQGTIHVRNLPSQTWISSDETGSTKVSKTTFEYDDYSGSTGHAALVNRTSISGHDTTNFSTSFSNRGNATAITRWKDLSTTPVGVTTYQQYDIAGNVVKTRDPRGCETSAAYSDVYGSPNGNATSNSSPSELSGISQTSYAFATGVTNCLSQTVYSQFDFYTGMPVDGQDLNGVVTSGYSSSDSLDRPTQIIRAVGQSEQSQTTFAYDDTNKKMTTTSDLASYNDNAGRTESYYDGLGRTIETRRYDGASSYIKTTQTYDPVGRTKRSYNPHRTTSASTDGYTENAYDGLGRVTTVTTSDSAVVGTAYNGNAVTVTDQAGKQRRSYLDTFGRLKSVVEPDQYGTLNINTDYTYNVLNDLTVVSQGSQTRTFVYDNLRRLTAATTPESGTIDYSYDSNDNLASKLDDRSITTTFTYDALNRVTNRDYSDSTPDVSYTYDNVTNGIGHLTKVANSNSETWYTAFDKMGRVTAHKQVTASWDHPTTYTYNLAGMLLQESYPSGRVVKNTIGSYGDLSQVETKPSAGSYTTRASNFVYTAPGAVASMQLGNNKYQTAAFNSRLQTTQIGLGTSTSDTSLLKIEYGYGSTSNNGNVVSQAVTVPGLSYAFNQTYTYDTLNRLATASETYNAAGTWSQTFSYDRYGNRNITAGTGTTSLAFSSSTNKITTSGYSYDNVGNTSADASGKSYTYDAENKMLTASNGGGTLGDYDYDGHGKRVKKYNTSTSDNRIFIYDAADKLIEETDLSHAAQASYVYAGGRLLSTETAGPTTNYLTTDILGTPRINTDASGNVTARHDYLPFGEEISTALTSQRSAGVGYTGSDAVRKQFTGHERDVETGLDFAQARMYSSNIGRFGIPDPENAGADIESPQSWNGYTYVVNNPLNLIDPSGLAYLRKDNTIYWVDDNKWNACQKNKACQKEFSGYEYLPYGTVITVAKDEEGEFFALAGERVSLERGRHVEPVRHSPWEQSLLQTMLNGAENRTLRFWRAPIYVMGTAVLVLPAITPAAFGIGGGIASATPLGIHLGRNFIVKEIIGPVQHAILSQFFKTGISSGLTIRTVTWAIEVCKSAIQDGRGSNGIQEQRLEQLRILIDEMLKK